MINEFIQELENNIKIEDTYTVRIDYIIERLKDINKELESYLNDRIKFFDDLIGYSEEDQAISEYSLRKHEINKIKDEIIKGVKW